MKGYLKINANDNVAVVLADVLTAGDVVEVDGQRVVVQQEVARGHKVALVDMCAGQQVVKYGYPIGHLTQAVKAGEWIHTHNLKSDLCDNLKYTYTPKSYDVEFQRDDNLRVMGYLRASGEMGIRNELWIVPTVGCVNGQAQAIAERLRRECDCSHLDDVRVYTHNYGCSQLGDDTQIHNEPWRH